MFTVYGFVVAFLVAAAALGAGKLATWPPSSADFGFGAGARARKPQRAEKLELAEIDAGEIAAAAALMRAPVNAVVKRAMDIVMSLAVLLFGAPLFALVALAIRLESPGPVFYRQTRVGLDGRLFEIWKFRSMRVDAERDGPRYAARHDDRVTKIGRIIRKCRIDELPQAINILRGEMSVIGPRPERPEFVDVLEQHIDHYQCRHLVKPGLTGWAQVKCEYAASIDDARRKLQYDLFYVRQFGFWRELSILAQTVRVALFGLGGR